MDPELLMVFKLPFKEQEKFFQNKLNIPTRKWDDLWKDQHAKGFMVAGAYKADLLNDFRTAVDKAITKGTTLEDFRKDFDRTVARHGWSYNGSRNWRSELIYSTNIRTSYAAGRWAQLTDPEQMQVLPYLTYKHGDSRVPRPAHLAWDGLTLPAADDWWKSHYPPNGWGCKCRVYGSTKKEYEKARAAGKGEAPKSEIDPETGEPAGIDKGWGYNVGEAAQQHTHRILESALSRLPDDIASRLRMEVESRWKEMPADSISPPELSELMKKVEIRGAPSEEFLAKVETGLSRIPAPIREVVESGGRKIIAGETLTGIRPELKGVRPRGYKAGWTWDNADGQYWRDKDAIVVAEKMIPHGKKEFIASTRTEYVIAHEYGHGYDAVGKYSASKEFTEAYRKERGEIAKVDKYFTQVKDGAGRNETFAELFAGLTENHGYWTRQLMEAAPLTTDVVRNLMRLQ